MAMAKGTRKTKKTIRTSVAGINTPKSLIKRYNTLMKNFVGFGKLIGAV